MQERILQISFNKSGSGSITKRITLPSSFMKDMGITEKDRQVKLTYDEGKKEIIIKKFKEDWNYG